MRDDLAQRGDGGRELVLNERAAVMPFPPSTES
jgi:hypothetical protein